MDIQYKVELINVHINKLEEEKLHLLSLINEYSEANLEYHINLYQQKISDIDLKIEALTNLL